MEPIADSSVAEVSTGSVAPPLGQLVIRNGRQSGVAKQLRGPITLIGREPGNNIRLNVEGVKPFHCVLAFTPFGLAARDLQTDGATRVNGEVITSRLVHSGDVLSIGPFEFEVVFPEQAILAGQPEDEDEKEALRIQAAAVVAQQSSLTLEEQRLLKRQAALEQQEQQLSAHLESKRQQILVLREEAREAQSTLQKERAAYEQRVARVIVELDQSRREVAENQRQAVTERQRLQVLRQRLKRRWHRHWAHERTNMQGREAAVREQLENVEKEQTRLQQEKEEFAQFRLRVNGEIELGRRELQEARALFQDEKKNFEEQSAVFALKENALHRAQQSHEADKRHWEGLREQLVKEIEGLENRIGNYRRKIAEHEGEVARLEGVARDLRGQVRTRGPKISAEIAHADVTVAAAAAPDWTERERRLTQVESDLGQKLIILEKLAGELADQRLYLTEQSERLADAERRWQQECSTTAAEMESAGQRLVEREQGIQIQEQELQQIEERSEERSRELSQLRRSLEATRVRMALDGAAWERERERVLADVRAKEDFLEDRLRALKELRARWDGRRRRQIVWLRQRVLSCEGLRREFLGLRVECLRRRSVLMQDERGVAERALALEQFRQETLGRSANPAATEKKLEQLRRSWAELSEEAMQVFHKESEELQREISRLDADSHALEQHLAEVAAREAELETARRSWEEQRMLEERHAGQLRMEFQSLRHQRDVYARQVDKLRDEVEGLAQVLLDEAPVISMPTVQAA